MTLPTTIDLQIVTPDRPLVREQVDEVEIPGTQGYFGVLPGHRPLLASMTVGELWYRRGQERTYLSIAFGFAEVLPDRVTILAKLAEKAEEIDPARAEAALQRAQEHLAHPKADIDYDVARVTLMKALTRLQVASHMGGGQRMPGLKRIKPQG